MKQTLLDTLRSDMRQAMKSRDTITTNTLKSLLARIANAEAVDITSAKVGATEVPRKLLSTNDIYLIIDDEINELAQVLNSLENSPTEYTSELQRKMAILQHYKDNAKANSSL